MNVLVIGSKLDCLPVSSIVIVKHRKAEKALSETDVSSYTKHCISSFVVIKVIRKILGK